MDRNFVNCPNCPTRVSCQMEGCTFPQLNDDQVPERDRLGKALEANVETVLRGKLEALEAVAKRQGKLEDTLAEQVNKQDHYARYEIEPMDFIVANRLGYRVGNIIKYVCRYPFKGQALSDLYKARDYLNRIIKDLEDGPDQDPHTS